ncbi:hypothetical protein ACVW0K_000449 [Streptomyces filamentosus]
MLVTARGAAAAAGVPVFSRRPACRPGAVRVPPAVPLAPPAPPAPPGAAVSRTRQPGVAAAHLAQVSAIRHSLPERSAYAVSTTGPPHRTAPAAGRAPSRRPAGACHAQSTARQAHHTPLRGPPPALMPARCRLTCSIAARRPAAAPPGMRWSAQDGREQDSRTTPSERRPWGSSRTVHTRPATLSCCVPVSTAMARPFSLLVPCSIRCPGRVPSSGIRKYAPSPDISTPRSIRKAATETGRRPPSWHSGANAVHKSDQWVGKRSRTARRRGSGGETEGGHGGRTTVRRSRSDGCPHDTYSLESGMPRGPGRALRPGRSDAPAAVPPHTRPTAGHGCQWTPVQ